MGAAYVRPSMPSPDSSPQATHPATLRAPLALLLGALVLRWLKLTPGGADLLPGFSPWMALAFTGTLLFPGIVRFWMIPAALILIDQFAFGWHAESLHAALPTYACLALAAGFAAALRGRLGVLGTLGGTILCSLGFYLVSNTCAWIVEPAYAKSVGGWAQALTTGLPGFPPSYLFLRNALLSDLSFSALLLLLHNLEARNRGIVTLPVNRATA